MPRKPRSVAPRMPVSMVSPIMMTLSVRKSMRLRAARDQTVRALHEFEVQHAAFANHESRDVGPLRLHELRRRQRGRVDVLFGSFDVELSQTYNNVEGRLGGVIGQEQIRYIVLHQISDKLGRAFKGRGTAIDDTVHVKQGTVTGTV